MEVQTNEYATVKKYAEGRKLVCVNYTFGNDQKQTEISALDEVMDDYIKLDENSFKETFITAESICSVLVLNFDH